MACLLFDSVSHILINLAVEMHVHNRVSFVRHQQPVDILKDQTDGRWSLPSFLLALEVDFGQNSIGG